MWLAKSTWIPKEKTESCEAFKMSYGTRKHEDREDDSAGGLISHLFLPFPVTPASRQGTFFFLTRPCQTPSRTAKGWPAVIVGTALASPWTPGRSVALCIPRMLWCYPGRTRGQTQVGRQTCNALYCTCWSNRAQNIGSGMKRKRTRVTILTSPISCFYKGNRQKGKMRVKSQQVIQVTKHESSDFFLHGSYSFHLFMMLDIFAFLHFSAAPKLSIKGQESTDVGGDQKSESPVHVRSGVARPVLLPPLSVCPPSPFPLQTCQLERHLRSIFLTPSPASDLSLESDGSGFSAGF